MASRDCNSTLGIHFFYVTTILVAVIILVATTKWTELPKFTDYLSTAATITSLMLGLLAIIYAYISNDSLSKSTGVVSEAAADAHDATTKISALLQSVGSLTNESNESNSKLEKIIDDLRFQLAALGSTAKTLDGQANAIASVLPEIPKGLDLLGRKFDEFMQTEPQIEINGKTTEKSTIQSNDSSDEIIVRSSKLGLLLIYGCYLSHSNGKPFNVKTFSGEPNSEDYMYGYFVALFAAGRLKYEAVDKSNSSIVKVTEYIGDFAKAKDFYIKRAENENKVEVLAEAQSKIKHVQSYFEISNLEIA
ncbi:hypothetical protein [uncultured Propionivibrio sp.]|uniref:hypothetical protein n=1 Tax=uncultured Propionivibrio sp. TaxID=426737 RepID=UPI0029C0D412|nr:hypothetical protein [uncultured Propionivibrio sp.]